MAGLVQAGVRLHAGGALSRGRAAHRRLRAAEQATETGLGPADIAADDDDECDL